jgi:tetratricopeptide (TPR) repeat protein
MRGEITKHHGDSPTCKVPWLKALLRGLDHLDLSSEAALMPDSANYTANNSDAYFAEAREFERQLLAKGAPVRTSRNQQTAGGPITEWEKDNVPHHQAVAADSSNYSKLAQQYLEQGRCQEAEKLFVLALELAEKSTATHNSEEIERNLEELAWFYCNRNKFVEAEPIVKRLVEIRARYRRPEDSLLVRSIDQLANIFEHTGKGAQAESIYRFLISLQEEALGTEHLALVFSFKRLAECYVKAHDFAAAEPVLLRALTIEEIHYGAYAVEISSTLQDLAMVYQAENRFDLAAFVMTRQLRIMEEIHGPEGLSVASALLKLADLYTRMDRADDGEPFYRRTLNIYEKVYGKNTATVSSLAKKLDELYPQPQQIYRPEPNRVNFSKTIPDITPVRRQSAISAS